MPQAGPRLCLARILATLVGSASVTQRGGLTFCCLRAVEGSRRADLFKELGMRTASDRIRA